MEQKAAFPTFKQNCNLQRERHRENEGVGSSGASLFDENDVSKFLDEYEDMCADYQLSNEEKFRMFHCCCEAFTT